MVRWALNSTFRSDLECPGYEPMTPMKVDGLRNVTVPLSYQNLTLPDRWAAAYPSFAWAQHQQTLEHLWYLARTCARSQPGGGPYEVQQSYENWEELGLHL